MRTEEQAWVIDDLGNEEGYAKSARLADSFADFQGKARHSNLARLCYTIARAYIAFAPLYSVVSTRRSLIVSRGGPLGSVGSRTRRISICSNLDHVSYRHLNQWQAIKSPMQRAAEALA